MPSFDSFVVGEDFVSEHFFTTDTTKAGESFQSEVLKLRKQWDESSKEGHESPLDRFRKARGQLQIDFGTLAEEPGNASRVYRDLRQAFGFHGPSTTFKAERSGAELLAHNVWSIPNNDVLFVEAQPADSLEDALAKDRGDLIQRPLVDDKEANYSASKLISELYQTDEPPQFIVLMAGRWLVLTERERWPEGRYLAADALLAIERNDTKRGGELDRFLAVFGRDSLHPDPSEQIWWTGVIESSVKHTVGVSKDLREGIRLSIEIIANDVLTRRTAAGMSNDDVDGQSLAKQSLRFLYRILFLLYAEASPEMGVIPVGDEQYDQGYGLDRIRELVLNPIASEKAKRGTHLYDSLNLLFTLVNKGHKPEDADEALTFENLEADLFSPSRTKDIDEVKLSNSALHKVLDHLLLTKEARGKDRGFISYAELGVNQLGAVYEGLMSYTGSIAQEDLHEVAKDGDASKGSWVVPVTRSAEIEAKHFVMSQDEITGQPKPVLHEKGTFVFRLAGRERQQSASYYTPEVLTKFVVSQALEELLDQYGTTTPADEILKLTVCEPALGSGAFAIEAVRQLAAEYLERKQKELDVRIPADEYPLELQKVKAQIALHQVHGVDLNATAVELAEVSLWLDTMMAGLQAPWFGLRLRRGNSLIGARRSTYSAAQVRDKSWLTLAPQDAPLKGLVAGLEADDDDPAVVGRIHHFLLPAQGWGAASDAKEVKDLAADAQKALGNWRKSVRQKPSKQQVDRLLNLSRRVESLWKLTLRRFEIAEQEARREIAYFGKQTAVEPVETTRAVTRAEIEQAINDPNGAYQRLRRVMDAWNALWFWPLTERATKGAVPPSFDQWLEVLEALLGRTGKESRMMGQRALSTGANWDELNEAEHADLQLALARDVKVLLAEHQWLSVCDRVARDQGFFHWELDFPSAFGRGGFDLQLGNPPWVRPTIDQYSILGEFDPRWQLRSGLTQDEEKVFRERTLSVAGRPARFVDDLVGVYCIANHARNSHAYSAVSDQPNLYRLFMVQTWWASRVSGVVGLLHPESVFVDDKLGRLRRNAHLRLRRRWQFTNTLELFECDAKEVYCAAVYGGERPRPDFLMASFLVHPETVIGSLRHDGSGDVPGARDEAGKVDRRPHRQRIVAVGPVQLEAWAQILGDDSPLETRTIYTANVAVSNALECFKDARRFGDLGLSFSTGWHETNARRTGKIEIEFGKPADWNQVVLVSQQIGLLNPVFNELEPKTTAQQTSILIDLENLPADYVPLTAYKLTSSPSVDSDFGSWDSQLGPVRPRDHYRLAWREFTKPANSRTLIPAIIPPGVTHVHSMMSAGGADFSASEMLEVLGYLSSLVVDFRVRVTGKSHMSVNLMERIQIPNAFPLASELRLRVARLVCLTGAFADLWTQAFEDSWASSSESSVVCLQPTWSDQVALRTERDRWQAQLEIDAISALAYGMSIADLVGVYQSMFGVLREWDRTAYWSREGVSVSAAVRALAEVEGQASWRHPQSLREVIITPPFKPVDRENELRRSYARFEKLLAEQS